jgi:HIV Tat-specific factor 1
LLDEQSKVYKVEGVDESAPAAPQKKRKQHLNGEEVRILNPLGQMCYHLWLLCL